LNEGAGVNRRQWGRVSPLFLTFRPHLLCKTHIIAPAFPPNLRTAPDGHPIPQDDGERFISGEQFNGVRSVMCNQSPARRIGLG